MPQCCLDGRRGGTLKFEFFLKSHITQDWCFQEELTLFWYKSFKGKTRFWIRFFRQETTVPSEMVPSAMGCLGPVRSPSSCCWRPQGGGHMGSPQCATLCMLETWLLFYRRRNWARETQGHFVQSETTEVLTVVQDEEHLQGNEPGLPCSSWERWQLQWFLFLPVKGWAPEDEERTSQHWARAVQSCCHWSLKRFVFEQTTFPKAGCKDKTSVF